MIKITASRFPRIANSQDFESLYLKTSISTDKQKRRGPIDRAICGTIALYMALCTYFQNFGVRFLEVYTKNTQKKH